MPDKAVFVVDDDAAVRQGLRFMLRASGYSVEAFASARSFLEDHDPRRGGCLLLDVRMPQMTGLELQQQLNVRGGSRLFSSPAMAPFRWRLQR